MNNGQVPSSAQAQWNHSYAICFNSKEAKPHCCSELPWSAGRVAGPLEELEGRKGVTCFPCIVTYCIVAQWNRLVIKDEI